MSEQDETILDADDTEGHIRRGDNEDEDTEGHQRRRGQDEDEDDDTEGHQRRR